MGTKKGWRPIPFREYHAERNRAKGKDQRRRRRRTYHCRISVEVSSLLMLSIHFIFRLFLPLLSNLGFPIKLLQFTEYTAENNCDYILGFLFFCLVENTMIAKSWWEFNDFFNWATSIRQFFLKSCCEKLEVVLVECLIQKGWCFETARVKPFFGMEDSAALHPSIVAIYDMFFSREKHSRCGEYRVCII